MKLTLKFRVFLRIAGPWMVIRLFPRKIIVLRGFYPYPVIQIKVILKLRVSSQNSWSMDGYSAEK